MKIEFNEKKDVIIPEKTVVLPERVTSLERITILTMIDEPKNKRVTVKTLELGSIILWEGSEYDNIGQWTDDDVKDRILEIYKITLK